MERQNPYLDYLVDSNFQGVNRLFVLSFGHNAVEIFFSIGIFFYNHSRITGLQGKWEGIS